MGIGVIEYNFTKDSIKALLLPGQRKNHALIPIFFNNMNTTDSSSHIGIHYFLVSDSYQNTVHPFPPILIRYIVTFPQQKAWAASTNTNSPIRNTSLYPTQESRSDLYPSDMK